MSVNLNYLYYKAYYQAIHRNADHEEQVKSVNHVIHDFDYNLEFRNSTPINTLENSTSKENRQQLQAYRLKTQYPGLLIGLGTPHESKVSTNEEIKLGFQFDYVTGLPVIPGSSVKGMLRSVFRKCPDYIAELLAEVSDRKLTFGEDEIRALEQMIFGKWCKDKGDLAGSDIFFDATIKSGATTDPRNRQTATQGNLMAFEYITSHVAQDPALQGLLDPNPVRLLKVRPNVVFSFSFILTDAEINGKLVSREIKKELFKKIMMEQGVGAKTNTGYGIMTDNGL